MNRSQAATILTLIFGDEPYPRREGFAGVCVRDTDSYLRARARIADHLRNRITDQAALPLQVYVQGERYRAWFADLRSIGSSLITIHEESIRRLLEDTWNTTLPAALLLDEILALNLEALPPPRGNVTEHILLHKLGKAWANHAPGPSHAIQLLCDELERLRGTTRFDVDNFPWLASQRQQQAKKWETIAPKAWHPFYQNYSNDAQHTLGALCTALYLTSVAKEDRYDRLILKEYLYDYPLSTLDEEALTRFALEIKHTGDRQHLELLSEAGRKHASVYLLRFWKTKLNGLEKGRTFIDNALAELPGHAAEEVQALEQLLDESEASVAIPLTQAQHEALRQRYGALTDASEVLDRLALQVLPNPPSEPDPAWMETSSLDVWLPWLLHEYLPYRAAADRLSGSVPFDNLTKLAAQAVQFSDWFCEKYAHMLHEGRDLITTIGREVAARLKKGERVIWLIWDNLPAHHTTSILKVLQIHGFHLTQEIDWKLALLPSVTKISFAASLSGLRPDESEAISSDDYSALVAQQFSRYHTVYRNSLRDLAAVLRKPKDLYVFHYRQHDKILHMAESQLEDTRENLLDMYTRRVAEQLAEAFSQMPADRVVSLIISTDHGSTRLPERFARSTPMPTGAELVEEHSSRAVVIQEGFDENAKAAYDPDVCTYLDPAAFGLTAPVLLTRGFRVWSKARRGSGYVHGGALPEEVLVPLLRLEQEQRTFQPLSVDVARGTLRRSELGEVSLRITNKNEYAVEQIDFHLLYEGRRLLTDNLQRLPANTSTEIIIRVRIEPQDPIRNDQVEVSGTVSAQVLGRIERYPVRVAIPASERAIRSRANEELDDFFD